MQDLHLEFIPDRLGWLLDVSKFFFCFLNLCFFLIVCCFFQVVQRLDETIGVLIKAYILVQRLQSYNLFIGCSELIDLWRCILFGGMCSSSISYLWSPQSLGLILQSLVSWSDTDLRVFDMTRPPRSAYNLFESLFGPST